MKIQTFLLLTFIMSLTFYSCHREPEHVIAAYRVIKQFTKKVETDQNLIPFASGGSMMNDIKFVSLEYDMKKTVNIREARKILINNANDFIETINNDIRARQFLHNYPFTNKNLRFGVSFIKRAGIFVDEPFIAYAILQVNEIQYCIMSNTQHLETIYRESYEEALSILQDDEQVCK